MKWTEIPAGRVNAAMQRFQVAMGDDATDIITRMVDDEDFVFRLVKFAANNGFEPSTSQVKAREIMGKNFFGVEEASKHFGVNPTKQQLAYLAEIPFSEEVLTACKDTHVLVAVFPMSILDIRDRFAKNQPKVFYTQDWYNKQAFAKDKGEIGWHLVAKTPVENSMNKTWDEQQKLLAKTDETPTARVLIYTMIGHFLASGERLFTAIYVRCSDLDSGGYRVLVGYFDSDGLGVNYYWDVDRYSSLGLSRARKQ